MAKKETVKRTVTRKSTTPKKATETVTTKTIDNGVLETTETVSVNDDVVESVENLTTDEELTCSDTDNELTCGDPNVTEESDSLPNTQSPIDTILAESPIVAENMKAIDDIKKSMEGFTNASAGSNADMIDAVVKESELINAKQKEYEEKVKELSNKLSDKNKKMVEGLFTYIWNGQTTY